MRPRLVVSLRTLSWALSLALGVAACSSSSPGAAVDAAVPVRGDFDPEAFGGARPAQLYVPSGYDDAKPAPLLVLLHGYGVSGGVQDLYLGLRQHAEARGFLYIFPDGTPDSTGSRYWNATDACCDFDGAKPDDSAYVSGLIREVGARYRVDPKRVFLVGHSNGAFMSFRLACDHADQIAGVAGIAGATWLDPAECKPSSPVSVLAIHGTADETVSYEGGGGAGGPLKPGSYPGALETASRWAGYDGCASPPDTSGPSLDLDDSIAGDESTRTRYASGCRQSSAVELWSIGGGKHKPNFSKSFAPAVLDWLFAHPKP